MHNKITNMKRLLLLLLLNMCLTFQIFARDMIYIPEDWRDDESMFFEILYMWYDNKGDYVILINSADYDMRYFKNSSKKYALFEIRGIDPKTVKMQSIGDGKKYIGKFKENYDCSKFEFYETVYENEKYINRKKYNSCFGDKDYSYQELKELGIEINII